jgi:hypothetical protein
MGAGGTSGPSPVSRGAGRPLTMAIFYNIMLGYFFGFALGVGCALAVFYAIYSGGYRKAVEHSLLQQKPPRYQDEVAAAKRRAAREILPHQE